VTEAAQAASLEPRPLRSIVTLVIGGALLALAVAGLKGWRDYEKVRARESTLETEIAATEKRIRVLEHKIQALDKDKATLDRVAREELGFVRPDEVVIVLPKEPAPADSQTRR